MLCFFYTLGYLFVLQMSKDHSFPGSLLLEPSPGFHHGPIVELTASPDPCLHFRVILWLFFRKYNFQNFNLLSKMNISKTAWVNPCQVKNCKDQIMANFFINYANVLFFFSNKIVLKFHETISKFHDNLLYLFEWAPSALV